MEARRRREPIGCLPVRSSWRSSSGVEMVLGSRMRGEGVGADLLSRALSFRWVLVVKLGKARGMVGRRRAAVRRQCNAGRMV